VDTVREESFVIGKNQYRIAGALTDDHITAERHALARARERFDEAEREIRETIAAQMRLEEAAEGWPEGRELNLWRVRYTTSCLPDGKPCWVYHTVVNRGFAHRTKAVEVLTPDGIQITVIEPPCEYHQITIRSASDLPEEWMVKPVGHCITLDLWEPITCGCTYCQDGASVRITDKIDEGCTLVSEAMRKIIDEIDR
jgi:hypothetical protein